MSLPSLQLTASQTIAGNRILIIEDEPALAASMRKQLEEAGYIVDHSGNLQDARFLVATRAYDGIVLDRRLPDGDGLSLLETTDAQKQTPPTLVVSALGSVDERIIGLRKGADDYMSKPFDQIEMVERVRALLRRPRSMSLQSFALGNVRYLSPDQSVMINTRSVVLPRRELALLAVLIRRPGMVILHEALVEAMYNMEEFIESNVVQSHVSRLRKRLRANGADIDIRRIRGVGYLLETCAL
jgi:two-component system, OmpR family, response regulator